jgi:hypothetical protein
LKTKGFFGGQKHQIAQNPVNWASFWRHLASGKRSSGRQPQRRCAHIH